MKQPNADRLNASFADELHAVDVGRGDGPELYPAWQRRHACLTDQLHHPDHPPAVLRRQLYMWGEEETQTLDTWATKFILSIRRLGRGIVSVDLEVFSLGIFL